LRDRAFDFVFKSLKIIQLKNPMQIETIIEFLILHVHASLVNDSDNVNDMIKKLIAVAELLYGKKDTLLEASGY
jgi:hypothetical protein